MFTPAETPDVSLHTQSSGSKFVCAQKCSQKVGGEATYPIQTCHVHPFKSHKQMGIHSLCDSAMEESRGRKSVRSPFIPELLSVRRRILVSRETRRFIIQAQGETMEAADTYVSLSTQHCIQGKPLHNAHIANVGAPIQQVQVPGNFSDSTIRKQWCPVPQLRPLMTMITGNISYDLLQYIRIRQGTQHTMYAAAAGH